MTHLLSTALPQDFQPERILIVRLSAHGDVIHTLPLLSALKKTWPSVTIGWLTEPGAEPLLMGHPLIDTLHVAQRPRWMKELNKPARWHPNWQEASQLRQELREANYDISIDVQGLLKSAVWPWLAKIPIRLGFAQSREQASRFYTHTLPPMDLRDGRTPAIQRYLDFARLLGSSITEPEFLLVSPPPESIEQVSRWLMPYPAGPLVALAPFTRWSSKHWTQEGWVKLIHLLLNASLTPVLLGGSGDTQQTDELLQNFSADGQSRMVNLVGQTDWPTMQAVLSQCQMLVGPDSAPLHLADALGKPVIGLYGPTAPGRTGPIGKERRVITAGVACQPCFQKRCPLPEKVCMTQLQPSQVFDTVQAILSSLPHTEAQMKEAQQ